MSAETIGRQAIVVDPSPALSAWDADMEVAATRSVPVLISAGPAESQEIASQLSRRSRSPWPVLKVVDCRQADAAGALQALGQRTRSDPPEVLLLQEVYALSRADQVILERGLEETLLHAEPSSPVRVLASSSVPLFDRVVRLAFRRRLYYMLNMIHLELPAGVRPA